MNQPVRINLCTLPQITPIFFVYSQHLRYEQVSSAGAGAPNGGVLRLQRLPNLVAVLLRPQLYDALDLDLVDRGVQPGPLVVDVLDRRP